MPHRLETPHPAANRHADFLADDTEAISSSALAAVVAVDLAARGFVTFDDAYNERTRVYVRAAAGPRRVNRADLDQAVRAAVLDIARAGLEDPNTRARARSRSTLDVLTYGTTGARAYLTRIRQRVADLLPEIDDDEHDEIRAAIRAARPAPAPAPSRSGEYRAERRLEQQAEDLAELRRILGRWLPLLDAGEHDLPDVWARWQAALAQSTKLRGTRVASIGKTTFYAALGEVTQIRTGAARRRYVLVQPAAAQAA